MAGRGHAVEAQVVRKGGQGDVLPQMPKNQTYNEEAGASKAKDRAMRSASSIVRDWMFSLHTCRLQEDKTIDRKCWKMTIS